MTDRKTATEVAAARAERRRLQFYATRRFIQAAIEEFIAIDLPESETQEILDDLLRVKIAIARLADR